MLFGKKEKFAIRIDINNYFHDAHVGEGIFNVYIENESFGASDKYATTFMCIVEMLEKYFLNSTNIEMNLSKYSKEQICGCYYKKIFSGKNLSEYPMELIRKTEEIEEWAPEAAFDDGTHIMHFEEKDFTRIIGFKSCSASGDCFVIPNSEKEIRIPKKEFNETIFEAYSFLKCQRTDKISSCCIKTK